MKKRAQLTFLIAVGIIVIIVTVVVTRLSIIDENKGKELSRDIAFKEEEQRIKTLINSCLKTNGAGILQFIGLRGGYARLPEKKTAVVEHYVPYYFYEGDFIGPSLEDIEDEISFLMNSEMQGCVNNGLEDESIAAVTDESSASTEIRDSGVHVQFTYPITLIREDKVTRLKEPAVITYPLRLKQIYGIAADIQDSKNARGIINVKYLREMPVGMNITIFRTEDPDTIIYKIGDSGSRIINEMEYEYVVANKLKNE